MTEQKEELTSPQIYSVDAHTLKMLATHAFAFAMMLPEEDATDLVVDRLDNMLGRIDLTEGDRRHIDILAEELVNVVMNS